MSNTRQEEIELLQEELALLTAMENILIEAYVNAVQPMLDYAKANTTNKQVKEN